MSNLRARANIPDAGKSDIGPRRTPCARGLGQLEQEKRKLQHLVSALEGGASAPPAVLKAVSDREKAIAQLEAVRSLCG